jgi:integrase
LREEIEKQPRNSGYVFPEVAALYEKKNFGMSWRVKQVLKAAGIETLVERSDGMQKASIKGFHSLRTTWITMALSAGVPMELVRRVTGHSTVDVVLKHYFRPGREAFRAALEASLPKMLTGSNPGTEKTPKEKLLQLVEDGANMEKDSILEKVKKIARGMAA